MLTLAGCSTPGPLHVYSFAASAPTTIADFGAENVAPTPSFLKPGDTVTGFAYDPFTDHFFLRLAPGDTIRVVDRPARAIKREFKLAQLLTTGGGDLAIRPRDGHVFAVMPGDAALVEFTRYGEFVGKITLEKLRGAPSGVAFDSANNRLLILVAGSPAVISVHSPDGRQLSSVAVDRAATGWLAFDSERREIYAPLTDNQQIGVFGEDGKFRGLRPIVATFLDLGPRSFLRMF
jgi:hypothetical protein